MGRKQANAFTLIELLVVVGVIVVLVALLAPALSLAMRSAESARCVSNIHTQISATTDYAFDNNRKYAPHNDFSPDYHRSVTSPSIVSLMRGTYIANTDVFLCPILAGLEPQDYGKFRSNDWQADGIFGGWDTDARLTPTGYMWLANYRPMNLGPLQGLSIPGLSNLHPQLAAVLADNTMTTLNSEPPLAKGLTEAGSSHSLITHKVNFFDAGSPETLQDAGHGGRGEWQTGTAYNDFDTTEQPVGYGDGHVQIRSRDQIKPRLSIGGDYPNTPGPIGTFLW